MKTKSNVVYKIIKYYGTQGEVARRYKKSQQTISNWAVTGLIPVPYVLEIEKDTNGKFPRHLVRPDIYPPP